MMHTHMKTLQITSSHHRSTGNLLYMIGGMLLMFARRMDSYIKANAKEVAGKIILRIIFQWILATQKRYYPI